jgi:hypothetical protein
MSDLALVALVSAVVLGVDFLGYLVLCAYVVARTNSSKSLRDVATAARAFPGFLGTLRPGPHPVSLPGPLPPDEGDAWESKGDSR